MNDCDLERVIRESERAAATQEMRGLRVKAHQLQAVIGMCKKLPADPTAQAVLALIRATYEEAY